MTRPLGSAGAAPDQRPLISPIPTAQITALSARCAWCAVRRVSASRQVGGAGVLGCQRRKAAERVTARRWSAATRAAVPGRT